MLASAERSDYDPQMRLTLLSFAILALILFFLFLTVDNPCVEPGAMGGTIARHPDDVAAHWRWTSGSAESEFQQIPDRIQKRLNEKSDAYNCMYLALDYHIPQSTERIIPSKFLKTFLANNFCEISAQQIVLQGDILTFEDPQSRGSDNFHHAAIALGGSRLLEKPDGDLTNPRFTTLKHTFSNWIKYFSCPTGGVFSSNENCLLVRVWRPRGSSGCN